MGLTRKKITVKRKGKTFQRSVMVRAEAIGKRTSGKKLNSLNPWEIHHTAYVKTAGSPLGNRQKYYGHSGPGSDHSWFAHQVGAMKHHEKTSLEGITSAFHLDGDHAFRRRLAGQHAAWLVAGSANHAYANQIKSNSGLFPPSKEAQNARAIQWQAHLMGTHMSHVTHKANKNKWGK